MSLRLAENNTGRGTRDTWYNNEQKQTVAMENKIYKTYLPCPYTLQLRLFFLWNHCICISMCPRTTRPVSELQSVKESERDFSQVSEKIAFPECYSLLSSSSRV